MSRRLQARVREILKPLAKYRFYRLRPVTSVATRAFHRVYYGHYNRTIEDTAWLGTPALKCPLDLWVYQELLTELRPELIVETGTAAGGSALFVASVCDLLGTGEVISIDVEVDATRPEHERITYLHGSSVDPAVVATVRERAEGARPVLVILDSDHSISHVLAELRAYAELVTPGSYLIVEDTNLNGHPAYPQWRRVTGSEGPWEATRDFLAERDDFVVDRSREKYFLTLNPGGFLRRAG